MKVRVFGIHAFICFGLLIVGIFVVFMIVRTTNQNDLITNAKNCRIEASDLGAKWKQKDSIYLADPLDYFEDEYQKIETKDENYIKSSQEYMKLLRESGVKDGYLLFAEKDEENSDGGAIMVISLVFTNIEGAQAHFNYKKRNMMKEGADLSNIGDEAVFMSEARKNTFRWLVRKQNLIISLLVLSPDENTALKLGEETLTAILRKAESARN